MSLRTRLIVAFFGLSVLPLAAFTVYTYQSNEKALREAAEREADLLAGELSQRMQLVTAQLSQRVEHLMDIQELETALRTAETRPDTPARPAAVVLTADASLNDQIARSLGEAAMLLNNVQLQGLRGGRGGGRFPPTWMPPSGAPPPPGAPLPPGAPRSAGAPPPAPAAGPAGDSAQSRTGRPPGDRSRPDGTSSRAGGDGRGVGRGDSQGTGRGGSASTSGAPAPPAPAPQVSATPPVAASAPVLPSDPAAAVGDTKLMIDLAPIRREMFRQIVPEGRPEALTPEQRQRIAEEVNQRMLGIVQGIQLGAKELQKRADEAQQAAATQTQILQAKAAQDAAAALRQTADAAARTKATESASAASRAKTGVAAGSKSSAAATPGSAPATTAASASKPSAASPDKAGTSTAKRKTSLKGNRLDVTVERDGEIVRQANAEINMPNVLATVFSTSRGDRQEVPFAVGRNGQLYTRSDADRARVEALGDVAKPDGPAMARLSDWIVVTTPDPSGSGLKLGIARPVGDSLASLRRTAARNAGVGLLFIAVALVGIVPLSSRLTRGLTTLSDGVNRIAQGDYRARVPIRGHDEVGRLASAFNQMAEDVEKHQRAAVEQERIKRELELGRQIQNEMLPHAPLRLGLTEIKGVSVPAREVGGDFFNYFELANGQVALLVGDVSGKGVGAALLMANIQASLRTRLALGQDLSSIAEEIDRDIEENSPGPLYATLFVGILDPASRQLRYVNAGHHPQFVLRKGGGLERMESTGLPVGLLAGRGHREQAVQLVAGDVLFFYTDGCVEAENETGDFFGAERLEALFAAHVFDDSDDVLKRVEAAVNTFRGAQEPFDDATMMSVRVG
jgi:serine phosphatase RsbU (regulator of sigma subunit)